MIAGPDPGCKQPGRSPSEEGMARELDEPDCPYPPRYWWLKRVALALVLLGLVTAGAWRAWAREARRRVDVAFAPIVARGEPVNAAGLIAAPVPPEENGAPLYLEAVQIAGHTRIDSPSSSSMSYPDFFPFPPRWHKMADRSAEGNQPIFTLMRKARGYRRFDWGVKFQSPVQFNWTHLSGVHNLANMTGDAALHAHVNGDDAAALEYVRDVMHAGRALDTGPTTVTTHMYTVYSIEGGVLYRLEMIAMRLAVAPEEGGDAAPATLPNPRPTKRPATRAQVRALIAELLDDQDRVDALRRGFVAQRAVEADMAGWFGQNVPVLRPMFELDSLRQIRAGDARVRAAEQPDFQAAREVLRHDPALAVAVVPQTPIPGNRTAAPPARRQPVDYTRLLTTDVIPATVGSGINRVIDYDMRTRAERRLAAAVLAAQLYRADHAGELPPTLEALVPKYLPNLPTDPFPAGGQPIRYAVVRGALPGGGDRALVYSTGGDGADDTATRGLAQQLPNVPQFGWQSTSDQWRDVVWFAPQTKVDPAEEEAAEKEWREEEARQQAKARATKDSGGGR